MEISRQKQTNRWMIIAVVSLVLILMTQKENLAQEVEVTLVDGSATSYATFQSHSQKVVSNKNGIFMTYISTQEESGTGVNLAKWKLLRSTDGGKTFSTIYEGKNRTRAPAMETDENDNIYLMFFDFWRVNPPTKLYFYRFLAKNDYQNPLTSNIPMVTTFGEATNKGKHTMIYDQSRQQFYVWGPGLYIIKKDGTIKFSKMLMVKNNVNRFEYPHFTLDNNSVLYASVTTQKSSQYLYRDIRVMKSPDGGNTWQKLNGIPHQIPIQANDPAFDRITLDDEFDVHTWLASAMAKGGKLHFAYEAQFGSNRFHYMRYNANTGEREADIESFKGRNIFFKGLSGFFASRKNDPNSPLYYIGRSSSGGNKIGVVVSYDNGDTWNDYAESSQSYSNRNIDSLGGSREITAEGYIVGSFTEQGANNVYAFRVQVNSLNASPPSPGSPTPDTNPVPDFEVDVVDNSDPNVPVDNTGTEAIPKTTERSSYVILRTDNSPTIDGDLSEFHEANAITFSPPIGGNSTTVKALWDSHALYLAYDVLDTELNAVDTTRDNDVWGDDSIEWFIDTRNNSGGGHDPNSQYMLPDDYQFILNILNTQFDSQGTTSGSSSHAWNGSFQSAVRINGTINDNTDSDVGYTVELEIPWTSIGFSNTPLNDTVLGMSFTLEDKDPSSFSYVMWPNDTSSTFQNASKWPRVLLSGATSSAPNIDGGPNPPLGLQVVLQ